MNIPHGACTHLCWWRWEFLMHKSCHNHQEYSASSTNHCLAETAPGSLQTGGSVHNKRPTKHPAVQVFILPCLKSGYLCFNTKLKIFICPPWNCSNTESKLDLTASMLHISPLGEWPGSTQEDSWQEPQGSNLWPECLNGQSISICSLYQIAHGCLCRI